MAQHSICPQFDQWITDPGMKIRGFEFVKAVKCRLGCLLTPSRASRGRNNPSGRICKRDRQVASLNHIAQHCQSTHGLRVERHDSVVDMVRGALARKQWRTLKEPHIPVGNSWLKPDLVCLSKCKKKMLILDPIICSANKNLRLEAANEQKVAKYSGEELKTGCAKVLLGQSDISGIKETCVHGIAISCRGSVPKSTRSLLLSSLGRRMSAFVILRVLFETARMTELYMRTVHVS